MGLFGSDNKNSYEKSKEKVNELCSRMRKESRLMDRQINGISHLTSARSLASSHLRLLHAKCNSENKKQKKNATCSSYNSNSERRAENDRYD